MMFSKKLQEARKAKGLTLEELASEVGSTKSYIWALENKDNPNPSMKLVNDLAKALDVTVEYLVDKQPNNEDQVFFREYVDLKPETKQQIRSILKALKQR
ncbi:helix-turn-helix domain-containing protein [Thiothrix lacustris]|jgi:transcriptional regulator with XRE-family HTH domain|uniref:helix-turn-helix domain-containing protein n=1 Tax=Thiothrix lacustris TaxID=525917 RepID=UPI00048A974F|nr:helix-turn-helix transcriptional regulator [Thiothrix lacustris]